MKIAFYAPLKAPDHAVPSGDRLMARQLIAALTMAGHEVTVASTLRAFTAEPDPSALARLRGEADTEVARIAAQWRAQGKPDLWFSYHPYYKAPDLLALPLAREFGIALATAEASYSARRNRQGWAEQQNAVVDLVRQAKVNLCFTERDATGLADQVPGARIDRIAPFIDTALYREMPAPSGEPRLLAIAMLRRGDKSESFAMLAASLALLPDIDWHLTIIGDGPAAATIKAMFAAIPPARIAWQGELGADAIANELPKSSLYVWPGCGEAYGLAYLEAQAAGLPVIAQNTAGIPAVVIDGDTGLLTPSGDIPAFADAIRRLLANTAERQRLSANARNFVRRERSLETAASKLAAILRERLGMIWQPLADELAEWRAAGLTPSLWLRDDDAVEPTPLLDRLVALTAHHKIPLVLAVIPAKTDARLAAHLRSIDHVHPCVHGWAHANHALPGEKKQELGGHREKSEVLVELARGFARLRELHGERLLPLLVPPWNRVSPDIAAELPQLGFAALSTFGHKPLPHPSGLAIVNCHVDLIDWKNGAHCRDYGQLITELTRELKRSRLSDQAPVGVLSHHLASTDDAFTFLERLFAAARDKVHWVVPQGFRA